MIYNLYRHETYFITDAWEFQSISQVKKINVRENRRSNHEWTIQKHRQYWTHKIQDEDKQNKKYNIEN